MTLEEALRITDERIVELKRRENMLWHTDRKAAMERREQALALETVMLAAQLHRDRYNKNKNQGSLFDESEEASV